MTDPFDKPCLQARDLVSLPDPSPQQALQQLRAKILAGAASPPAGVADTDFFHELRARVARAQRRNN